MTKKVTEGLLRKVEKGNRIGTEVKIRSYKGYQKNSLILLIVPIYFG